MTSDILDPRLNPYRTDLAALKLQGRVQASRFVSPITYQVSCGVAALRKIGTEDGEQFSQALHGEVIDIYEEVDGFGWGQMRSDGYVGWFDMAALSCPVSWVTRKVSALRTYAYSSPCAKSAPYYLLSLGAQVCETGLLENGFVQCARAGWVYSAHLAGLNDYADDPVSIAEQFVEAPYQWGGVESLGLDCSGLVQTAYKAAGVDMPRDSDMQCKMGSKVDLDKNYGGLMRGDIIGWRGHVAIMTDSVNIIHANAFHLKVAREPLAEAAIRIAAQYGEILTIRRISAR